MFSGDPTIQTDDTMLKYEGEGNRAVKNLKDVMTAMKYLQDGTVAQRLTQQKDRIAARFRELDVNQLPNWTRLDSKGKAYGRWQSLGLEGRWNTFIRDKCATARTKAVTHIDDHLPKLREAYISDFKRGEADKQAATGDTGLKDLIEKIEKIEAEWTRYKPISWTNPF